MATAISIGNFDGVHRGHLALIGAARDGVGDRGRIVVLAFDPHPATVLRPEARPPRLSTFEQRAGWLRDAGADEVEALRPSAELLAQTPREFIERLVVEHRPAVFVEGPDFRFGRGRAGSVQTLRDLGAEMSFRTLVIEPVEAALADQSLVTVSSSMIRRLIGWGRMNDAAALLGRPYELVGRVRRGDRRGRELDMPTANLDAGDHLLPADGVYTGSATNPQGTWHRAAISVGTKPTFGDHPRCCEAHLIGWRGDLDEYGWTMTLRIERWLRDQIACRDVDALRAQMQRDVEAAGGTRCRDGADLSSRPRRG